ncbi:MAG TPA: DUF4446 family protein [Firmicutes bacterium]|nr:DUF4446 family protein [Bacillota bacterium]
MTEKIFFLLENNLATAIAAAVGIGLLLAEFIILLRNSRRLRRLEEKYNRLLGQGPGGSLEEHLLFINAELKTVQEQLNDISRQQEILSRKTSGALSGFNLVRYNAFPNTGGELSFSLALLDGKGNGVILSSILGRDESRLYAKPVVAGKSRYGLSKEEEEALRRAKEKGGQAP